MASTRQIDLASIRVGIVFGGPSPERDISLDSARTFYDAIRFLVQPEQIDLFLIELDGSFSTLEREWIYCNTIDDISLSRPAEALRYSERAFVDKAKQLSALFLFVHGEFGEDGKLEDILRRGGCSVPVLGSEAHAQATLYDKSLTCAALKKLGYPTSEQITVASGSLDYGVIRKFVAQHRNVVVKPARGGSSDGVALANKTTIKNAIDYALRFDDKVVVENFIQGREFSIIIFQDTTGHPFPLMPTEILVADKLNPIYTRLKKYMPGSGAAHDTPASFGQLSTERIRSEAGDLFLKLQLSDWARFDGFLLADGSVIWSDLNGIPGFGMDSLLFQQSSLFGLDQVGVSYFLLAKVLAKAGLEVQGQLASVHRKRPIFVLGGGASSERQVSRMSWLNVLQKLTYTQKFDVHAVFVNKEGEMWEVPSFITLQHTVEEIEESLKSTAAFVEASKTATDLLNSCQGALKHETMIVPQSPPARISFDDMAEKGSLVFLALHGGPGEDGRYQAELERRNILYNGSGPEVSRLCMNKHGTALALDQMGIAGFRGSANLVVSLDKICVRNPLPEEVAADINAGLSVENVVKKHKLKPFVDQLIALAEGWQRQLNSQGGLVFKPIGDGCSSGVFLWKGDTSGIVAYILASILRLPEVPWSFLGPNYKSIPDEIRMKLPYATSREMIVEELHTSAIDNGLVELTVAVLGKKGKLISLMPSETRKEFDLLTLEEKFCKGVGINVTPPPQLAPAVVDRIRSRVASFANALGIDGYARIDLMFYPSKDELVLIEVNSLPGLSAATVTFTQALVTPEVRLAPSEFLERIALMKSA